MSKLEITEIAINDLIPYVNNARTHSDEQVAQIAASIREFGWTNPILVDGDKGIIAGHGRLAAARKLKMNAVPAIQLDGLSEAKKKALIIADNKIAINSGWDVELLKVEMKELDELGINLEVTGFGVGELTALFDEPDFQPGSEDDQGKLDELSPKIVQCPHCGQDFDLRQHGQS